MVSCPCALVISIPLSFFGGIGGASKKGVLVKGSNYLEALAETEIVVFDKTGTLTKGVFNVQEIHPEGVSKEELLELTAHAESYSNHPISLSLKRAYSKEIDNGRISDVEDIRSWCYCNSRWQKGYGRKYQTYENDGYPLFQGRADRYYCTCCC